MIVALSIFNAVSVWFLIGCQFPAIMRIVLCPNFSSLVCLLISPAMWPWGWLIHFHLASYECWDILDWLTGGLFVRLLPTIEQSWECLLWIVRRSMVTQVSLWEKCFKILALLFSGQNHHIFKKDLRVPLCSYGSILIHCLLISISCLCSFSSLLYCTQFHPLFPTLLLLME